MTTDFTVAQTDPAVLARLVAAEAAILGIPLPASAAPPGVADASAKGAVPRYALEDHTHAGNPNRARAQTATDGTYTWTYPMPFAAGVVPIIELVAEATAGSTDVINAQVDGTPTNTTCAIRVTRTQRSVVSLIGLTILSLPSSPGATWIHAVARAP